MKHIVFSQWIHLNKFRNSINYGKETCYLQMPPGSMSSSHFPKIPWESHWYSNTFSCTADVDIIALGFHGYLRVHH